MVEFLVKTILILFLLFYVVDYILFYSEFEFYLKEKYRQTRIFNFMRRCGFWGRLNMFCPGTRISYYTYKIFNSKGVVVCEFPDYTKLNYLKQLLYYRFRKTGYAGLKDQYRINLLKTIHREYGFEEITLQETRYRMPYKYDDKLYPINVINTNFKYPESVEDSEPVEDSELLENFEIESPTDQSAHDWQIF